MLTTEGLKGYIGLLLEFEYIFDKVGRYGVIRRYDDKLSKYLIADDWNETDEFTKNKPK